MTLPTMGSERTFDIPLESKLMRNFCSVSTHEDYADLFS